MGLIKAALSSTFGVLSDQFKEYFYCESLSADVLVVKGQKRGGTGNEHCKEKSLQGDNGDFTGIEVWKDTDRNVLNRQNYPGCQAAS